MSEPTKSAGSSRKAVSGIGCLLLSLVGFVFLLMIGIGTGILDLGITLLFGWISLLRDTLPRISWNWGAIVSGIGLIVLILVLGHWFLSWLGKSIASTRAVNFSWPLKWTCCGLAAIGLSFLVGMAVAGAAHQIGWIMSSDESLFHDRFRKFRQYSEMSDLGHLVAGELTDNMLLGDFRTAIIKMVNDPGNKAAYLASGLQSMHLLIRVDEGRKVEGVLIFPRDVEARTRFGGQYVTPSNTQKLQGEAQLKEFIKANEPSWLAF